MNKVACIDIGTNSVLLSVAVHSKKNGIKEELSLKSTTQLGLGMDSNFFIKEDFIKKTADTVCYFVDKAKELSAKKIFVVGTHALRKAVNSKTLADIVKENTGIDVDVISGEKEASLTFLAVEKTLPDISQKMVLDIGGGSTEISCREENGEIKFKSMSLGCLAINPDLDFSNLNNLQEYFRKELSEWKNKNTSLVCSGGTATSLAVIALNLLTYESKKIHGYKISINWLKEFYDKYNGMTAKEKKTLPCISSKRALVLGNGIAILLSAMSVLKKNEFVVSDAGLRFGILLEYFNETDKKYNEFRVSY